MKLILKLVAALVALIIVAAIAIPMFISADYLKAQLQEQVKKATGRELAIKGKASLSILPNIAIHVEDVTLGNPAGFTGPYLVHIDKLQTGAALKPLLSKELRITGVTLEGAKLNLEQNASGAKNWDFASSKPAVATPEKAGEAKASPLKQLAIGRVTVKNTNVHFAKAGAKPIAVENINLALDGADGSGPLSLNGSVDYQKQPVQFKLGVEEMKALMAGKAAEVLASITLPSGNVNFDGVLSTKDGPAADGKFSFTSDNLGGLMAWATGTKPTGNLPKKVSVKSTIALKDAQHLALNELNFAADSLSGSGKLVLVLGGAVPAISGDLKLGTVNLNELTGKAAAAPATAGAAVPKQAAGNAGWSDAPLNLAGLRAVNANVKVAIEKLVSGKLEFTNIITDIAMNGGNAKINLGNLSLYGGAAKGTVTLDGSGAGAGLATNLTLSSVNIENLMTAMSGASKLEGIANLVLNINGRGASQRALVGSLNGGGNIKINDGAIKGINVASFLRDAKKGFILGDSSTESTDFTEMTASYNIVQGVVSNKDLSMKSPVLRLAGSGSINLPARTIDYRAVPTVVSSLQGQGAKEKSTGLDIPLLITGPWSAISITPDLEGMLTNALTNPEALEQNIKGVKDGISKFNSPKDIGKALLGGSTDAAPAAPATATGTAPAKPKPAKDQLIEGAIGGVLGGFGQ